MSKKSSSRKPQCRDARKFRDLTISGIKMGALTTKSRSNHPPGQHGQNRKRSSDYATMLAEKQKLRLIHGHVKEAQFHSLFEKASRMKGQTSLALLQLLEVRLVNVLFKAGFAATLAEARQLIAHRSIEVALPGKEFNTVNCPMLSLKPGTVVRVRQKAQAQARIQQAIAAHQDNDGFLEWLKIDHSSFTVEVSHWPDRDQLPQNINENLIIEFYSK